MSPEEIKQMKAKAFIVFEPGRYYSAMWSIGLRRADVLMVLWREDAKPNLWHFDSRLRSHVDDKIWGSKDVRKFCYQVIKDETEEGALKYARELIAGLKDLFPVFKVDELLLQCDAQHTFEKLDTNPPSWWHKQSVRTE